MSISQQARDFLLATRGIKTVASVADTCSAKTHTSLFNNYIDRYSTDCFFQDTGFTLKSDFQGSTMSLSRLLTCCAVFTSIYGDIKEGDGSINVGVVDFKPSYGNILLADDPKPLSVPTLYFYYEEKDGNKSANYIASVQKGGIYRSELSSTSKRMTAYSVIDCTTILVLRSKSL